MPPIQLKHPEDLTRLRRLALSSQGLLKAAAFGKGRAGARKAIEHIGYVQIDTISVIERAHHHVLYSRVPNCPPGTLNQMLKDREIFEYWAHAASFLPMADYRFSLPYKQDIQHGQIHWFKQPNRKLMQEVLTRIEAEGPLRSRDLEANPSKCKGWWDWKPAKKALEQLFMEGQLMVSHREGFQKVYDLTERVLPADVDTRCPDMSEFATHLLDQQLRCHGVVSSSGLTYLRRNPDLRREVNKLLKEKISQKSLQDIQLPGGEIYLIEPGALDRPLPRCGRRLSFLSPFDNAVIQRKRLQHLFGFDYQIECYVPEAKRRYGYFSLPLLYQDRFIGRMDCKAHRKNRELEINFLHMEENAPIPETLLQDFAKEIRRFAAFQQCEQIRISKTEPTALLEPIRRVLN